MIRGQTASPDPVDPSEGKLLIRLLPTFACLEAGVRVEIPPLLERVISRLATAAPDRVSRETVIQECGLDTARAPRARLRQICWMAKVRTGCDLIVGDRKRIGLAAECRVDFDAVQRWSSWLLRRQFEPAAVQAVPDWLIGRLDQQLLSDWGGQDLWLQPVQEQWDVVRGEVMEGLARTLLGLGNHDLAMVCAHRLVQQDPVRESAWEILISALLRSGRRAEARSQFERLSHILDQELGVSPCSNLDDSGLASVYLARLG